jgi:FtsZ-interacting cell division protein ZipA
MSQIGKLLLWVALVGAIVAVVFGVLLSQQYGQSKKDRDIAQAAQRVQQETITKDKEENAALTAANTQAQADLTAAKGKVDDLTSQVTAAQKAADDAKAALTAATDSAKTAQDKYDAIQKDLDGKTPQQYKDDVAKAQSDLQAALSEQKILQDTLDSDKTQIADLTDAVNRVKEGGKMPGVSGKVTFVDNAWNFVILDVGLANGVVPNGELIVYRNNAFLGKVRVTKVDPNDAVAEILPDIKGSIQVGDKVLN